MRDWFRSQLAFVFVFACLFVQLCQADNKFSGRVVKVVDGDTVDVLMVDKTLVRVRLAGIDAPERKQPFSQRSREHLAGLVAGKDVLVFWNKRDRYNRLVGKVVVGKSDICLAQVQGGFAWHFKRYEHEQSASDRVAYARAEDRARTLRVGLWSQRGAIAPWNWRDGVRPTPRDP